MNDQLTITMRDAERDAVIFDLNGDLNRSSEEEMLKVYQSATEQGIKGIHFNFSRVASINSSGIAILIGIVTEARKNRQVISVFGLTEHYEKVFKMIGLPKYITIFRDEIQALGAGMGGTE